MAKKKRLSEDLDKMLNDLKLLADKYNVRNAKEFWRLEKAFSEWKISCLVEEELTPKGKPYVYTTESGYDPIDYFSER